MSSNLSQYHTLPSSTSLPSTINEFRSTGSQYLTKDSANNFDASKTEALRRTVKPFPLRIGGHSKEPTNRRNRTVDACKAGDRNELINISSEIRNARFWQEDAKEWGVGFTAFSLPGMVTGAGPAMLAMGIPMITNAKRDIARDDKTLKMIQENI
jgi:hypothetical protein